MVFIPKDKLAEYRAVTFRTAAGMRITNRDEAVEYVNQRGFVYFWPIREVILPSLWSAVAGDRPVADAHDDPGHVTWGWKDQLLGQRAWYYAKVLRKRATFISMEAVPYFYALSENYGALDEDYLTIYEQGRLTLEAKAIYEALLDKGILDTIALRKAARMTSKESDARFNKALTDLQVDFKVVPVGVTDSGAWKYAFAYDIAARHYPEIQELAHEISERQARQELTLLFLKSLGAAQMKDLVKLFGWRQPNVQAALDRLVQEGKAVLAEVEEARGEWYAVIELADQLVHREP
jgi:hypothetical protein